jgi:Ca2+-binding RTX toxin-like protein
MATIQPPVLPTEIPQLPPVDPVQGAAVKDILKGIDLTTATVDTTQPAPAAGVQVFTDTNGNSFAALDAGAFASASGGKKFKLKDLPEGTPVILSGSGIPKVKGGDANEQVINSSNDDMKFKSGGGDDVVVSTGFGQGTFKAGTGNDSIVGGTGDDLIKGNEGNDNLSGSAGNDTIVGGSGQDTIEGGQGSDVLTGGTEADTFVFNNEPTGADVITDFSKEDILKIADRNGDGQVTANTADAPGDYMIEQDGGDVVVHLYDKNGLENGRIKILNYKAENLQDPESDGTFTF